MNWVALFPGQGSQHQKMGLDLFEEHQETLVETLDEIMNNIRWRHSTIKNIIDWRRFTSGG